MKRAKRKQIVDFHNFSRFDRILLIHHIISNIPEWELKPLMRNNELYQLEVYEANSSGTYVFQNHLLHSSCLEWMKTHHKDASSLTSQFIER